MTSPLITAALAALLVTVVFVVVQMDVACRHRAEVRRILDELGHTDDR